MIERVLTFEQITDDRFANDIEQLLKDRINKISEILNHMEGVQYTHSEIQKVTFNSDSESNTQYRCRFYVRKEGRKTTWNDVYKAINSVKAVPYSFVNCDWGFHREKVDLGTIYINE